MMPTDNPQHYLNEFFKIMLNPRNTGQKVFQPAYYRALLCDSNVRYLRNPFLQGNITLLRGRMAQILDQIGDKTEKELADNFNMTLYNIVKFHLDTYIGKENTEKNLEAIDKEMNRVIAPIFFGDPPFRITVDDTVKDRDESKTDGSKFRIFIVPKVVI